MLKQVGCKMGRLWKKKACCHVANAFLRRLELICPISRLKISKIQKMHFWHKAEGVNGLKSKNTIFDGIPTYSVFNFPSKTPALTIFLKHQRAGNLQCIHKWIYQECPPDFALIVIVDKLGHDRNYWIVFLVKYPFTLYFKEKCKLQNSV